MGDGWLRLICSSLDFGPVPQKIGAERLYRSALVCAYVVESLPLFLPLNTQFRPGKGSIVQGSQNLYPLENRTFQEMSGPNRLPFLQFKSCIVHHEKP